MFHERKKKKVMDAKVLLLLKHSCVFNYILTYQMEHFCLFFLFSLYLSLFHKQLRKACTFSNPDMHVRLPYPSYEFLYRNNMVKEKFFSEFLFLEIINLSIFAFLSLSYSYYRPNKCGINVLLFLHLLPANHYNSNWFR